MLQNAYLLAKIGADTAENEQHFAKNLRKTDNYPTGRPRRAPTKPVCTMKKARRNAEASVPNTAKAHPYLGCFFSGIYDPTGRRGSFFEQAAHLPFFFWPVFAKYLKLIFSRNFFEKKKRKRIS